MMEAPRGDDEGFDLEEIDVPDGGVDWLPFRLDDDERETLVRIRRQLESNAPDLTTLCLVDRELFSVGRRGDIGYYFPFDDNWERDGNIIGNNTHLREIHTSQPTEPDDVTEEKLALFFRGFSINTSIQMMNLSWCNLFQGEIFTTLIPFFQNNCNFRELVIEESWVEPRCVRLLSAALSQFKSLREFTFTFPLSELGDNEGAELIEALSGHYQLRKLVLRDNLVGRNGCAALADFLRMPNSELTQLNISENALTLDDEGMIVLADGLAKNTKLVSLDLRANANEDTHGSAKARGWAKIFGPLRSAHCALENLNLQYNKFGDEIAISLAHSLDNNRTLKKLDLSRNPDITITGWQALFDALRSSKLEDLDLMWNEFSDDEATYLTSSLDNNDTLKRLILSRNPGITAAGWVAIFSLLQNPVLILENLQLRSNNFTDEIAIYLNNSLANNKMMKILELSGNYGITAGALERFAMVLGSSNSSLEKLELDFRDESIHDGTLIQFAWRLLKDDKLTELALPDADTNITTGGWMLFSIVLCMKHSIMATFISNHSLEKVGDKENNLPDDLLYHLELNRNSNKFEVARQKIIITHFTGDNYSMQPFADMQLGVLPCAIAWMAEGCCNNTLTRGCIGKTTSMSLFYQFVRNLPSFFAFGGVKNEKHMNSR